MSRQMSLEAIRSHQIRERSQQEQKRTEWSIRPESHSMPQEVCPLTSGTKGRKYDFWDLTYLEKKTEAAPYVSGGNLSERRPSLSRRPNDGPPATTLISEPYGLPETSLSSNDLDFLDDFFDVNSRVVDPNSSRTTRRDSSMEAVSAPSSSCASPFAKAKSIANYDLDLLSDNIDVCNLNESVEYSKEKEIPKGFGVRGQHRRSFSDLNVSENCTLPSEIFGSNFRRMTRELDLSNPSHHRKVNPNDTIDGKRKNSRTLVDVRNSDHQAPETSMDERHQKSMGISHPTYGAVLTNRPSENIGVVLDATFASLSDPLSPPSLPENIQESGITTLSSTKPNWDLSTVRAQAEVNLNNKIRSAQNEALSRIHAMEEKRQREEKEKEIYAEGVNATLATWRDKKEGNIRALLCSLNTILWAECEWNPVHLSQLITPKQVKVHYVKAISKVHPDKLRSDVRMDRRLLAQGIFSSLNEAWDAFRQQNPTP